MITATRNAIAWTLISLTVLVFANTVAEASNPYPPELLAEYSRASMLQDNRHLPAAREIWLKLASTPYAQKDATVFNRLGANYLMDDESGKNRLKLSQAALNKSIAIDPEFGQAYRNLSGLAYQREQYELALTYATKAMTCKEKDVTALWDRARAYAVLHKNKEALADITEMVKRFPQQEMRHYVLKAQILENLGRIDDAVTAYRQAAHWRKDWASFQIINCLAIHNRIDEAIVEATSLVKLNPQDDHAVYIRGQLFVKKKDFKRALADYSQAISIEPLNQYYRERATVYEALGQHELAKKDLEEAKKDL